MRIAAVDCVQKELARLSAAISEATPGAIEIEEFSREADLMSAHRKRAFDIAFIAAKRPGMDGVAIALSLKELTPTINIVLCAKDHECMEEALAMRCSGYISGPVGAEDVRRELGDLRFPVPPPVGTEPGLKKVLGATSPRPNR